jgi:uncharacterized protein (DUF1778 family)
MPNLPSPSAKRKTALNAARRAAEDTLMDRTIFAVNPKAHTEFLSRIDAPPRANARLRRSLKTAAPWER